MECYLEVTEDNVEELRALGIECEVDDELTCDADYDVNHADPSVGIMNDDVQVNSVTCEGHDVQSFFCDDTLHEQVFEAHKSEMESMQEAADDARFEAYRERQWDY